jgi:NDP-sugar pyrophosphorylase family protein
MKAIILAAGKGTRMGDLTKDTPKPLLTINGKTLLEYKLDVLPEGISEVVIVIGYLGEKIKSHLGEKYKNKKLTYVEVEPLGTGFAVWSAQEHLAEQFIVMCGDDLYSREDIQKCIEYDFSSLIFKTSEPQSGGKIILKENFIDDIQEGKHEAGIHIATGLYFLQPEILTMNCGK